MLTFIIKATRFLLRNISRDPLYIFFYIYAYAQKSFIQTPHFFSTEHLMEELHKGKSLIRIGDGEIYTLNFGNIALYEPYNKTLRQYFFDVIHNYNTTSPYIIGIPEMYIQMSNQDLNKRGLLRCWLPLKIAYIRFFNKDAFYFDAHAFYRDGGFNTLIEPLLHDKHSIIVTKKETIENIKKRLLENKKKYLSSITFIETKERESFSIHKEIEAKIQKALPKNHNNYRVLIACGPASKAIIYTLSKQGIICYDIGKGIETIWSNESISHLI